MKFSFSDFLFNNKEARITISNTNKADDRAIVRNISELSVIHELLHLRYEYIVEAQIDGKEILSFHKYIAHQSLEIMAKTLLMTRYNLDYNYFYGGEASAKR